MTKLIPSNISICASETSKNIGLCSATNFPLITNNESELWIPLIPEGTVQGRDGRNWTNPNAQAVINQTKLPFMLDADHESELSTNTQAQGWFTALRFNEKTRFIEGKLELNDLGRNAIENKHYKFYSPAFMHNKNKQITQLTSVGLTNKPNLNVPALNNTQQENTMDEIIKALGLAENATSEEILEAIKALKETTKAEQPSLNAYVPKATFDETEKALNAVRAELNALKTAEHQNAVEISINAAIKAKKIAPADKDYFKSQCATAEGLKAFNTFIEKKAPLIGDVDLPTAPNDEGEKPALNAVEKEVFAQLGITEGK